MKITDEMVKIAMNSLALTDFPDCTYPDDWSPEELRSFELQARNALAWVAPLIRSAALEEAARVAQVYKDKCDMRAAIHKKERNSQARDAALDKFEAALEIESAIRSLKDKPHE